MASQQARLGPQLPAVSLLVWLDPGHTLDPGRPGFSGQHHLAGWGMWAQGCNQSKGLGPRRPWASPHPPCALCRLQPGLSNVCRKITGQLTSAIAQQEDVAVQLEALDILSDMLSRCGRPP